MKVIGISGPARSGKDTMADSLITILGKSSIIARKVSFANALKQECRQFLLSTIGIDSFTDNDEEKKIIRPFLVTWGTHVRRKLDPDIWVKKVEELLSDDAVTIIADVRYPNELEWIRSVDGYLIYLDRNLPDGSPVLAANDEESYNCPILASKCDFHLTWASTSDKDALDSIAFSVLHDTVPTKVLKSWI